MAKQKKHSNKLQDREIVPAKIKKHAIICPHKSSTKPSWRKDLCGKFLSLLSYLGLILSITSAVYLFLPKIKIYTKDSLDTSNPFKTPFIIENQTVLSIYDIEFICGIRDIKAEQSDISFSNFGTSFTSEPIPILLGNESTTTFCAFPFITPTPITSADIEIVVKFRPKFFKKQKSISMRFNAMPNNNGYLFWLPKALSEN